MRTSIILLVGAVLIASSSFVSSHTDIQTVQDLFRIQNFMGLAGVVGGVVIAWATKSPINGNAGMWSKITGNGTYKVEEKKD